MEKLFELDLQYFARTDSINVVDDNGDEALLSEEYGRVVEAYQKKSHVAQIKAEGLGDASSGSMVFSRFQNAAVGNYGAARTATAGASVIDDQVTVNLDQHKEIVEELALFDVKTYGINNLIQRRSLNHALRMAAHTDRAAWAAAFTAAAAASQNTDITWANGTTPDYLALVEEAILKVETVSNDYVDGVDREMIVVAVTPTVFSKIKNSLTKVFAYNGTVNELVEVEGLNGARIVSEHYLPTGTDFIATTVGNIAQPIWSQGYTGGERIPLTNNVEVSLFFDYGTKILAPDLVFEGQFAEAAAE